jgi:hypothetical protein
MTITFHSSPVPLSPLRTLSNTLIHRMSRRHHFATSTPLFLPPPPPPTWIQSFRGLRLFVHLLIFCFYPCHTNVQRADVIGSLNCLLNGLWGLFVSFPVKCFSREACGRWQISFNQPDETGICASFDKFPNLYFHWNGKKIRSKS